MIILHAKDIMTYDKIKGVEAELTEKLLEDVAIIPANFDIVSINNKSCIYGDDERVIVNG